MYWNREDKIAFVDSMRLIETWDVLKWLHDGQGISSWIGLIETWDVLKWICVLYIMQ